MSAAIAFGDTRLPERFWAKVNARANGCWEWRAHRARNGYGQYGVQHRQIRSSHCVAYEALVGPVPKGFELDHLCRNRPCCNPAHLEPVTRLENIRRGDNRAAVSRAAAARSHCKNGHERTLENTRYSPGRRYCRRCEAASQAAYQNRKKNNAEIAQSVEHLTASQDVAGASPALRSSNEKPHKLAARGAGDSGPENESSGSGMLASAR